MKSSKKIGSTVFATNQGLGVLAKAFYDHGIINKVWIQKHSTRKTHYDWYPDRLMLQEELLECDALLFFETPFNWKLIPQARERGIRTALMPMYECTNFPAPYEPDVYVCPSLLDLEYYKDKNAVFIPVPVKATWRLRERARVFVHNAGNGGIGGRNGTKELLQALPYVKSPIKLIIRTQEKNFTCTDPRVEIRTGTVPYDELFNEGDVFIFPEKFNGLSLPLQEAFASGMLVMAGNRFPINTWLPVDPLIPVDSYKTEKIAVQFESAVYDPREIARTIDTWFDADISDYSREGREFGLQHSFDKLSSKYFDIII